MLRPQVVIEPLPKGLVVAARIAVGIFATLLAGCAEPAPSTMTTCFDWTVPDAASTELVAMGHQGGGPSFAALLTAHFAEENPSLGRQLQLDDEGDVLRVCSGSLVALDGARDFIARAERNPAFLRAAVARAVRDGNME